MTQASGYRERNSTADKALTVLQMFTDERPELTAVEVAENLGVARSTAYRYLQTLVQSHFLTDTGHGSFRLGLRVLELARIARRGYGLSDLCVPAMRELANEFHQTVLLTKQMGNSVVCLEREESRQQYVRLSYERGSILSINAGASALILLAWQPEERVRQVLSSVEMRPFTQNTVIDVDAIIRKLVKIREQGFAHTEGEVDAKATGIAAPLFDSNGEVTAGLSVVVIRTLVDEAEIERITHRVVDVAAALTGSLALLEARDLQLQSDRS
ncbi:MAG: IclR family transcriptional regulator [Microbacterium sp.]